jgi:cyanophycin synthetase
MPPAARPVELRVLDGPNLYFPRPAIKLRLEVSGWMRASEARVREVGERLGVRAAVTGPGAPNSEQRRRSVARIAAGVTRAVARASGSRRLAVRGRPGPAPDQVVIAFPWRRRTAAEALADEVATAMAAMLLRSPVRLVAEAGARVAEAEAGPEPAVPDPEIPVVQVTGTNGKTTTVRLLAHIVRASGLRVAYSSTDGVFQGDGRVIERGDYSGFGGAAMALERHPDVAVLETARGGLLQRGSGVLHNDVAVVTNVSEDHLGLHGIDTVDELAEVKSIITTITRPEGWDVLNADDPRVLAMRRHASGRAWLFSMDPDHPALREALAHGGRAISVLDGKIVSFEGSTARSLVALLDVPITLAGISRINAQNALAASAAALALGLPSRAIAKGLRTFVMDRTHNPGRANLFRLDGRIVFIDYAHNEAGMIGLTEALVRLCRPDREVWLAICTAGDRTDDILRAFAFRAAVGSDHLAIAELTRYLRGRTRGDIVAQLRAGARDAGTLDVPVRDDELGALKAMVKASEPGDVVSVTALGMRPEIFRWLRRSGATPMSPADVRRIVRSVATERDRGASFPGG